ncbi:MAG: preprotein translocase subunit SecA [Deltaproteobacteria bacterium]|nr:preprotein translocase subunit SecA [Deltaproteobacteria bacterium]
MNVVKAMTAVFGTRHEREIRRMMPTVHQINRLEPTYRKMSDFRLRDATRRFRERLARGETLDDILPEAFAAVREAAIRAIGMRPYDVQLIGAIVLHEGKIAEMRTGEGKTLVAALPLYLNALTKRGCHLVTVNDYLAKRDSEWMGRIYRFMGMSVGVIVNGMKDRERQEAYRADITYGTNNEFGFDYLRDNMKDSIEQYVHKLLPEEERGVKNSLFHYAIVDEVDSILIDEARTPLIISGPAEEAADLYMRVNEVVRNLKRDVDYTVDYKDQNASLTDQGVERVERRLGLANLYDPRNLDWLHHVNQALRAHTLYKRDVQYIVEEGKVIIIDEFTGRKMEGRRWSDGLHQAIEAKEGLKPEEENQTLATVTFQNFFRMYKKLSGMTGTAETEAEEFHKIYELDVMVIPTNVPCIRDDHDDVIYKTEEGKLAAVIEEIIDAYQRKQPVLVGTVAVEKTEELSKRLRRKKIPHEVLNAKNHEREALIVAQAGAPSAVTISTNMAGRGTDIILGGNPEFMAKREADPELEPERYAKVLDDYKKKFAKQREVVLEAGGLHILGTERHESRRIDNQLRGRAGRQGDPGSSSFYLSLEDDLMRYFGGERLHKIMEWAGMPEDVPIEHPLVNKSIERAQRQMEAQNFDIRKNLLEYDNVMNHQRTAIYALRRQVLEGKYVPELTEDERKAGKHNKVPDQSGKWTLAFLSDKVRPWVNRLLADEYKRSAKSTNEATGTADIPDPEHLTHLLYRTFGAKVDLQQEVDEELLCQKKATREVASSLIQQRERLLDMAYDLAEKQVATYCPEGRHQEDWDTGGLEDAVLHIFDLHMDGLEWLCHRKEIEAACADVFPIKGKRTNLGAVTGIIKDMVERYCQGDEDPETWDLKALSKEAAAQLGLKNMQFADIYNREDVEAELNDAVASRCDPDDCRHKIQEQLGRLTARIRQYGADLVAEDFKDWLKQRLDDFCPMDTSPKDWDFESLITAVRKRMTRPDDALINLGDRTEMVNRIFAGVERFIALADQEDDVLIAHEALKRFTAKHCPAWDIEGLNDSLNESLNLRFTIEERETRDQVWALVHQKIAKTLPRDRIVDRLTSVASEEVCDRLGVKPPSTLKQQVTTLLDEHCPDKVPCDQWNIPAMTKSLVLALSGEPESETDISAGDPLKFFVPVKGRFVTLDRILTTVQELVLEHCPSQRPMSEWDLDGLGAEVRRAFYVRVPGLEGTMNRARFEALCKEAAPAGIQVASILDEYCPADRPIEYWDIEGLEDRAKEMEWDLSDLLWRADIAGLTKRIQKAIQGAGHIRASWAQPENLPKLLGKLLDDHCPEDSDQTDWDFAGLEQEMEEIFCERFQNLSATTSRRELKKHLLGIALNHFAGWDKAMSLERRLWVFRHLYLEEIDDQWIEHLKAMDHLREGIGLRGYGQRDPKLEYQREGYDMFVAMMGRIRENVASKVFRVRIEQEDGDEMMPEFEHKRRRMMFLHAAGGPQQEDQQVAKPKTVRRQTRKVGPNEPCPCGSGKKYKNCHMLKDKAAAKRGELPEWAALRRAASSAQKHNEARK